MISETKRKKRVSPTGRKTKTRHLQGAGVQPNSPVLQATREVRGRTGGGEKVGVDRKNNDSLDLKARKGERERGWISARERQGDFAEPKED